MLNEADTCRILITPKLQAASWENDQIREQVSFTDGRIVAIGNHGKRKTQRRADYTLPYGQNYPIAMLEAEAEDVNAFEGLMQAKVSTFRAAQAETQKELDALLPSILDKAFKRKL